MTSTCGITSIGYFLPSDRASVEALVADGRTTSDAARLRELGYGEVHLAGDTGLVELAALAVDDLVRRGQAPPLSEIDLLVYGAGLGVNNFVSPPARFAWMNDQNPLPFFKFPATQLQDRLGLPHAQVIGVSQLACNAMHGCLRVARGMIAAEPALRHVLCVTADRFPQAANREIVFNLMSDGASATVVSRDAQRGRLLAFAQRTRGYYWDGETRHDHLIAAYFPLAKAVIDEALAAAGLSIDDLALFIPHNITTRSWHILGRMLGLPQARIYTENIERIGHVVGSDNLINLADAIEAGRVQPGDKVALFVTGFGAHWSCWIVEV